MRARPYNAVGHWYAWRVLACLAALATAAPAQTLNLDAPSPPAPGSGRSTLALAERLDRQITALRDHRHAEGDADSSRELRVALRILARHLLRSGEQAGDPGSAQLIAGRTIALRIDALDRHVRSMMPRLPREVTAEVATRCVWHAERLPLDAESLWRHLRDTLAPLVVDFPREPFMSVERESTGWWGRLPGHGGRMLAQIAEEVGAPPPVLDAAAQLDERLALAASWPAFERSRRVTFANAADSLWLFTSDAALPINIRTLLQERFIEAARLIAAPPQDQGPPGPEDAAAHAGRSLRMLALLARCLDLASRATPDPPARQVRESLTVLASSRDFLPGLPPGAARDASIIDRLVRVEGLLWMTVPAPGSREIVSIDGLIRQARPAIKPLEEARRRVAADLLAVAARAVVSPDLLVDPAFLHTVAGYRERWNDLLHASDLSQRIGHLPELPTGAPATQWVVLKEYEPVGERVLVLARGLTSSREHDEAIVRWRELAADIRVLTDDAGFVAFRRAVEDPADPLADHVRAITAGRGEDLLSAASTARARWLDEARRARTIDSPALREASRGIESARRAAQLAVDWASMRASLSVADAPGAASADAGSALAGWELSTEAAQRLFSADLPAISAAIALAADGSHAEFLSESWKTPGFSVRSLPVEVAARARALGVGASSDLAADALGQIAIGLPDPDRGGAITRRSEWMAVCRYLEELAWAMVRGDVSVEQSLTAYLYTRVGEIRSGSGRSS